MYFLLCGADIHLHNGIHRTGLLTEAAVNAFGHVDVIARCPPAAVTAGLSLNCDCLKDEVDPHISQENHLKKVSIGF